MPLRFGLKSGFFSRSCIDLSSTRRHDGDSDMIVAMGFGFRGSQLAVGQVSTTTTTTSRPRRHSHSSRASNAVVSNDSHMPSLGGKVSRNNSRGKSEGRLSRSNSRGKSESRLSRNNSRSKSEGRLSRNNSRGKSEGRLSRNNSRGKSETRLSQSNSQGKAESRLSRSNSHSKAEVRRRNSQGKSDTMHNGLSRSFSHCNGDGFSVLSRSHSTRGKPDVVHWKAKVCLRMLLVFMVKAIKWLWILFSGMHFKCYFVIDFGGFSNSQMKTQTKCH